MFGLEPARTVLEIENFQTHFFTAAGVIRVVDGVSYTVRSGEILGGALCRICPGRGDGYRALGQTAPGSRRGCSSMLEASRNARSSY